MRIWWGRRFTFGGPLAEYLSDTRELRLMEVGDIIRIQGMAASGMDTPVTGVPVNSIVPETAMFRLAFGSPDQTDALAGGLVSWVDTSNIAKDVQPYWVRSRVDGPVLRVKQWVQGETEPIGWDLTTAFTSPLTPVSDGYNGVWVGHVQNGSSHRFRYLRIRRNR